MVYLKIQALIYTTLKDFAWANKKAKVDIMIAKPQDIFSATPVRGKAEDNNYC